MIEWVNGTRLTDAGELQRRRVDTNAVLETGLRSSVEQLLVFGFMHADPHPGNLLVDHHGRLVYIDFGAVTEVCKLICTLLASLTPRTLLDSLIPHTFLESLHLSQPKKCNA